MIDRLIITSPPSGRTLTAEERAAGQVEIDAVTEEAAHAVNRYMGFESTKMCEAWCGGELSPGAGREFCKCMRPDRYFCTAACMAEERPLNPQPDVPAHEAWTLRHMAQAWKAESDRMADALAAHCRATTQETAAP